MVLGWLLCDVSGGCLFGCRFVVLDLFVRLVVLIVMGRSGLLLIVCLLH